MTISKAGLMSGLLLVGMLACSSGGAPTTRGRDGGQAGAAVTASGGNGGSGATVSGGGAGATVSRGDVGAGGTASPGGVGSGGTASRGSAAGAGGTAPADAGAAGGGGDASRVPADAAEPTLTLKELQDRYVSLKYGMFLHFNMSTFARQPNVGVVEEHELGGEDEKLFNPTALDTGQWADAAVAAGMKYMVLTTKHHGGFALWDTKVSTHDVAMSNWKGGKGDVLREFVDAARARGLRVGFYFSIWDETNNATTQFIKNQLEELLTGYGPIDVLWFDGWGWKVGYTAVPYQEIHDFIKTLQPNCLVLENNHKKALQQTELVGYEQNDDGVPTNNTLPAEVAGNIRADGVWFYHPTGNCTLKTVDVLAGELKASNDGHANFLLDVTPDDRGLIPQCQVDQLKAVAARAKM